MISGSALRARATHLRPPGSGTLNVGGSIVYGAGAAAFNFNAGTLNLSSNLLIAPTGPLANLTLSGFHTLAVGGATTLSGVATLTVDRGTFSTGSLLDNGGLAFTRGTFSAGTLTNQGRVELAGSLSTLGGGTVVNQGLVTGDGRVTAALSNTATGGGRRRRGRPSSSPARATPTPGRSTSWAGPRNSPRTSPTRPADSSAGERS